MYSIAVCFCRSFSDFPWPHPEPLGRTGTIFGDIEINPSNIVLLSVSFALKSRALGGDQNRSKIGDPVERSDAVTNTGVAPWFSSLLQSGLSDAFRNMKRVI